jgi:hypothetical protein
MIWDVHSGSEFFSISDPGDGRIFKKALRASLFNDDLSSEPNSVGSISLDSGFNLWRAMNSYLLELFCCVLGFEI